jgi:uncharacterized membrane protein
MLVERRRHIAKTISYRILSTLVGFLLMWWISGSIKIGTAFGIAELVYNLFNIIYTNVYGISGLNLG